MTQPVLLNNIDHHDLRVVLGHTAAFGDAVNQVLVFPTEFEEVQRHYPIVFRKGADGAFQAVALLGLDRDENLFLEHGWRDQYVPAVRQHGPFTIGLHRRTGDDGAATHEPMIHVDLDHPRISRTEGVRVFLEHGGQAPYLDHIVRLLRVIHTGIEVSTPMFAAFEAEGLIVPALLQITLDETTQYDVPDCFTIGAEQLAALDGAALERLHRGGFLRSAFMVAASLANVNRLVDLKNRIRARATMPALAETA